MGKLTDEQIMSSWRNLLYKKNYEEHLTEQEKYESDLVRAKLEYKTINLIKTIVLEMKEKGEL